MRLNFKSKELKKVEVAENFNNEFYLPDMYKNPFKMECVESVHFLVDKSIFDEHKINMSAFIEFKNGNTKGTHKIEASNFSELVQKVHEFINSL